MRDRNGLWRTVGFVIGIGGFGVGLRLFAASEALLIVLGAVILVGSQLLAVAMYRRYPVRSRHRARPPKE